MFSIKNALTSGAAALAVAATFGLAPIAVEDPHPKIGGGSCGLQEDEPVGSDAEFSMAEPLDLRCVLGGKLEGSVIDQDEVVADPFVLSE